MARKRPAVPKSAEARLLYEANHTCCLCHDRNKPVMMHHMDGDNANNRLRNLVALCLECHDRVEARSPTSKGYTPQELRKYKEHWTSVVRKRRTALAPMRESRRPITLAEELALEILAMPDGNKRVREKLNQLYEIWFWGGHTRNVLAAFQHIGEMSGMLRPKTAAALAEKTAEFCLPFVRPDLLPLDPSNKNTLRRLIGILETLGKFVGEFNRRALPMNATMTAIADFMDVAISYNLADMGLEVAQALVRTRSACEAGSGEGMQKFTTGLEVVARTARTLQRRIRSNTTQWKHVRRRLASLARSDAAI